MFGRNFAPLSLPDSMRVVLIAGGSGAFGRAVVSAQPEDAFIANVSKRRTLEAARSLTCHFDLSRAPERAFAHLAKLLPRVDVFVYAAYSPTFTSFEEIERKRFLAEYELNVYTAMRCLRLCGETFWRVPREENRERSRKAILVSSAAAVGKTARPELATYSASKAALNALGPYAHDYMRATYGVPVAVLAPGALSNESTRSALVARFWQLATESLDGFVLETIR